MLTQLYNTFWRLYNGHNFDMYSDKDMEYVKGQATKIADIAKSFLVWLIENGHIEEIKSTKKSGPDLNDYIKYIADTEDPVSTLVGMLK